jgi:succinoglycan biosynthesis transport protein ExoP
VTVILRSRHIAYQIIDANDLVRHYGSADKQAAAVTLARNTTVRHTREGSVEIEVTDSEPKRAAAIVNSYVDLLKQFTAQNVNLFLQRQKALYLKDALATTTGELKRAEDALAAFSTENKVISIDAEAQMLVQTLGEFEKQLGVTEAEADYAAAMLAAMRSALARIAASSPLAPPAHSPYLQKLRSDLVELNYELAMALKDRTEEDPWVKRLRASIDETMIQARAELEHIGAAAKEGTAPEVIDLAAIDLGEKAKVEALQAARNDLLAQMKDVPQTALEYLRLKREVEVREKVYEALSVEYEQARVGQMVEEEPFVVLDRGEAPTRHSKPRLRVNVAIAFVLSTVIGMLVALAVEGRSVRRR